MRVSNQIVGGVRGLAILVALTIGSAGAGYAQAPKAPAPAPRPPAPAKSAPAKPAAPAAVAPAPKAAPAADLRFKSKYTTGDQVTESTAYIKGARERYELADMVLLRQHDLKRSVQISRASKTYLVTPEGLPPAAAAADPTAATKAPGVVMVATSIVDTGERKTMFGQEARHVKTTIERQPQGGACDPSKQRIETDAWYIDLPKGTTSLQDPNDTPAAESTCHDEIKTTQNGDPKALGFPVSYSTTFQAPEGKPIVVTMEVTDFEVTSLNASLFEIPQGMTAVMNVQELSKAVSNANEAKLAAEGPGVAIDKKPGALRIGVPEVANKTTQAVDTRALRTHLITELTDAKVDAVPMAAASQPELEARAKEQGIDYLLIAEIAELKATKPGGMSKMMKVTAGDKNAGQDITEAKVTTQLVRPGEKPRLTTTTSGKDGGVGLKTGLGLAKFAGTMYLKMYMGGMMGSPMGAMHAMSMMNMGGMGMAGSPALMAMQTGMGGGMRMGMGLDRSAGAASFLMQQAMMGTAPSGMSQQGPSFEAPLGDALDDAAKSVVETLKKPETAKKK